MQLFQVNAEIYDEDSMLGRETSYLTADNAVKAAYYARGILRNICLECSLNLEELIRDHWSIFYKLEWPDKEIIYGYSVEVVPMDSQKIDCSHMEKNECQCIGELYQVYYKDLKADPVMQRYEILYNESRSPLTDEVRREPGDWGKEPRYKKGDRVCYRESDKVFEIDEVYGWEGDALDGLLYTIYEDECGYMDHVHESELRPAEQ